MTALKNIYNKLDRVQRTLWFRIAASVIAVAAIAAVFGTIITAGIELQAQRTQLLEALQDQNLLERDELALDLAETGMVTVAGQTYGNADLVQQRQRIFNNAGNIQSPAALTELLLSDRKPAGVPDWLLDQTGTAWLLAFVFLIWAMMVVWLAMTLPLGLTVVATAIPVAIGWLVGSAEIMWYFGGVGLLTFTFILCGQLLLLLFDRKTQPLAIAHTVIKEAGRTKVSLIFIVALLLILPLIPMFLDPEAPLRFRVQSFISRSFGLTYAIAALFTLFLGCSSVAFEIRDRQIWQLVSKPMSHLSYVFGKWLGVMAINVVILIVAGISILTFIQYLRSLPVAPGVEGQLDAIQLRDAVLTARVARKPTYDMLDQSDLMQRVDNEIERMPDFADPDAVSIADRARLRDRIIQQYLAAQRSIPPQQMRDYTFEGLHEAREQNAALSLHYRFNFLRNDPHERYPVFFAFNNNPDTAIQRQFVPEQRSVVLLPANLIRGDGTLEMQIGNMWQPTPGGPQYAPIMFEEDDLELLYIVGTFEGNFVRALLMNLTKLAFLAVLAIFFSTFLSFPVACLASLTVFLGGTMAPFLAISVGDFRPAPMANVDWGDLGMAIAWIFNTFVYWIAQTMVFALQGFGENNPKESLVEGKLISWTSVIFSFFWLLIVWSGIGLLAGWAVMRRRELAIYSGHG